MRTARELLAESRELVEPSFRAAIDELPDGVRLIAGYHAGLWDADGRPGARPGKGLRPALVLACGRAAAGADAPAGDGSSGAAGDRYDAMIAAAVAVELMHDFTLLHDDVMDRDPVRRHRRAAWDVFGVPRAVLAGDTVLALALNHLAPLRGGAEALAATLFQLCRGQGTDLDLQGRPERAELDGCVAMAEDKTGALLGCACQLGAMAAGSDESEVALYRDFGRHLGVAFQLTDDLLGIWGDPSVTGKPVHSDLAARKMTLPVAAALAAGNDASRELWALYGHGGGDAAAGEPGGTARPDDSDTSGGELSGATVQRAADLVEEAGGRAWAQAEADRRAGAALNSLALADPEPDVEAELRLLVELVCRRDS